MVRFVSDLSPIAAAHYWFGAGFPIIPIAPGTETPAVDVDYWLGAAISVLLVSYLVYALLRAERF